MRPLAATCSCRRRESPPHPGASSPPGPEHPHKPARETTMKENSHMQSWAKRGLQTALVTGGLLMLGTGIDSADENVDPDIPASPLDLNVTVPYPIADNALGTPIGQVNLGGATGEISTKPVTGAVK